MVLYCVALLNISYDPGTSAPMPCQGGPGFRFISDLAHAVSGKGAAVLRGREGPSLIPARSPPAPRRVR